MNIKDKSFIFFKNIYLNDNIEMILGKKSYWYLYIFLIMKMERWDLSKKKKKKKKIKDNKQTYFPAN